MAAFNIAYQHTRPLERGYANHPNDTGGETYAGISRVNWPKWQGWVIVDAAKSSPYFPQSLDLNPTLQDFVEAFYQKYIWNKNKMDALANQAIATEVFDTAVNMGARIATLFLQEALNLTNKNRQLYPDIVVDGVIGPVTINTTNKHPNPKLLHKVLNALQAERYLKILRNNPTQEDFTSSWFNNRVKI